MIKNILLFLFCILSFLSVESHAQSKDSVDFYLKKYDYGHAKKVDYRGKVVLVMITSSWDLDFNNAAHKIKELQRLFSSKDVVFMYIVGDLPERWTAFAEDRGLKGEFFYLPSMSKNCKSCFLSNHFDESNITSYYIIAKDGTLLNSYLPSPDKNSGIQKLLSGASTLEID